MKQTLVGETIKKIRTQKGMSAHQLAEKAQISLASLYNYEKGTQTPSHKHLDAIGKAIGIPASMIETLALDTSSIKDPETRKRVEQSLRNLKLLIMDVFDLV